MLPSPGLILTLVGMYGLMFLTYKTANHRRVFFPLSPLPASWAISWAMLNAYLSAGMGDIIGLALGGPRWCSSAARPMC
jgi:modulator of FtsH protease